MASISTTKAAVLPREDALYFNPSIDGYRFTNDPSIAIEKFSADAESGSALVTGKDRTALDAFASQLISQHQAAYKTITVIGGSLQYSGEWRSSKSSQLIDPFQAFSLGPESFSEIWWTHSLFAAVLSEKLGRPVEHKEKSILEASLLEVVKMPTPSMDCFLTSLDQAPELSGILRRIRWEDLTPSHDSHFQTIQTENGFSGLVGALQKLFVRPCKKKEQLAILANYSWASSDMLHLLDQTLRYGRCRGITFVIVGPVHLLKVPFWYFVALQNDFNAYEYLVHHFQMHPRESSSLMDAWGVRTPRNHRRGHGKSRRRTAASKTPH